MLHFVIRLLFRLRFRRLPPIRADGKAFRRSALAASYLEQVGPWLLAILASINNRLAAGPSRDKETVAALADGVFHRRCQADLRFAGHATEVAQQTSGFGRVLRPSPSLSGGRLGGFLRLCCGQEGGSLV